MCLNGGFINGKMIKSRPAYTAENVPVFVSVTDVCGSILH